MGETIYVTPPDLHLPVQGLRFYFIGGSPEWRQQVQGLVDEVYNASTVTHYFTPEPIDDKDIPWVIANIYHADLIVANLDIINMLELTFIASLFDQLYIAMICTPALIMPMMIFSGLEIPLPYSPSIFFSFTSSAIVSISFDLLS